MVKTILVIESEKEFTYTNSPSNQLLAEKRQKNTKNSLYFKLESYICRLLVDIGQHRSKIKYEYEENRFIFYLRSEEHTLNSSHVKISYAVFCLKKKIKHEII